MHRFRLLLCLVIAVGTVCGSCREQRVPELVPVPDMEPTMTYWNSFPPFVLKAFLHAPGNFTFRVENRLDNFRIAGLPEISSPTGSIRQARLEEDDALEFNLLIYDEGYRRSPNDVTIAWTLDEQGPGGFLRSKGEILIDIGSIPGRDYTVQSVLYRPSVDQASPANTTP